MAPYPSTLSGSPGFDFCWQQGARAPRTANQEASSFGWGGGALQLPTNVAGLGSHRSPFPYQVVGTGGPPSGTSSLPLGGPWSPEPFST